jgi:hypothetical protein
VIATWSIEPTIDSTEHATRTGGVASSPDPEGLTA